MRRGSAEWRSERRRQAIEQRQLTWGRIRWSEARSFLRQLERLPAELPGGAFQSLLALAKLQQHRYGVVIASGYKIAEAAGIHPSTFWRDLPELVGAGALTVLWRGGGTIPGGDGHSNVYQAGRVEVPLPPPAPKSPPPPAPSGRRSLLSAWFQVQLEQAARLAAQGP